MIQVGLTGNVASGKSLVARVWAEEGVPVVSADELAREAVAPGSPALDEIRRSLGEEMITAEGELDRARMRRTVFADPDARTRLEEIVHPRIGALRREWLDARREEGCAVVVSEIPLLFEAGLADGFDVVVVVHAPEAERRRRLVEDRGIPPAEADRILASQGDPEEKRARADHVLLNAGTPEELAEAARDLLRRIRGGRGRAS